MACAGLPRTSGRECIVNRALLDHATHALFIRLMASISAPGEALDSGNAGTGEAARPGLLPLALGSLGVVFGDIGTSPLYAFREAIAAATGGAEAPTRGAVLGVLSLILWTLTLIVSIKYVLILLRAD